MMRMARKIIIDQKPNIPMSGSTTAAHNSQTNDMTEARLHPSAYLMDQYCSAGTGSRAVLDSIFTTYATTQQLDDLEAQILTLTNACATIPADMR